MINKKPTILTLIGVGYRPILYNLNYWSSNIVKSVYPYNVYEDMNR